MESAKFFFLFVFFYFRAFVIKFLVTIYPKNDIPGFMKIAFLHYHLKTGGVTTVLKQQLGALSDRWQTLVLTGHSPETLFPARIIHIPELAYSSQYKGPLDPDEVAQGILEVIHTRFNGPCDVLHVHNPTLAKNDHFLKILKSLQTKGVNLLLQIHDFAEDGRLQAYFTEAYPTDCHYSVINGRDYDILLKAGLKPQGLHLLANMVAHPRKTPPPDALPKPMVLYPVRAIRRKNIGEAILLSLFFQNERTLSITLPPNSAADIKSYQNWKAFVKDRNLKVEFDRGLNHDFETSVMSADSLITTSITEGFGFSYLEPWLFGKMLWGRKLPDICHDFEKKGIDLQHLYDRLLVPVDWFGLPRFRKKWTRCVHDTCRLFNHSVDDTLIRQAFDLCTTDGNIDFGLLDEGSQKKVIDELIGDPKNSEALIQLNPFLTNPGDISDKNSLIRHNREAIEQSYNQKQYGQILGDTYDRVANTSVKQSIDKRVLISAFLDLERFSLLKWSEFAG
jgi:hypothetical protein